MRELSGSGRPRVAVIGGGIFGVTAALVLASSCDVVLLERSGELLRGATFANHGRQHRGFHYPRSPETAQQCLESQEDFRSLYAEAEVEDFPNYYIVAADGSKTTVDQYLQFCDSAGLKYRIECPPRGVLSKGHSAACIIAQEGVLDYQTLAALALDRLRKSNSIEIRAASEVIGAKVLSDGRKQIEIQNADQTMREDFDFVVNATYAHHNRFCEWLHLAAKPFQFNLQELAVIELPDRLRLGVTIMDGPFPSVIPLGRTKYHLLAHVEASQLAREVSCQVQPLLGRVPAIESNWEGILEASAVYLPILKKARYVKSLFVDRVVDASAAQTDARLTDITDHGQGCFSIFAAKVVTCVSTAHKISRMIVAQT